MGQVSGKTEWKTSRMMNLRPKCLLADVRMHWDWWERRGGHTHLMLNNFFYSKSEGRGGVEFYKCVVVFLFAGMDADLEFARRTCTNNTACKLLTSKSISLRGQMWWKQSCVNCSNCLVALTQLFCRVVMGNLPHGRFFSHTFGGWQSSPTECSHILWPKSIMS